MRDETTRQPTGSWAPSETARWEWKTERSARTWISVGADASPPDEPTTAVAARMSSWIPTPETCRR
jgi:hypothetical protein